MLRLNHVLKMVPVLANVLLTIATCAPHVLALSNWAENALHFTQKLSKNLGFKYFKKADDDDRAGMATMGTAGMFRKASQLFTVALGLQQDPQVDEWTKYSKFKAVYISKEIKAGRIPESGSALLGTRPRTPAEGGEP